MWWTASKGIDDADDLACNQTMNPADPQSWIDIVARAKDDDPVLSPCIGVCVLDPASGFCTGCARTLGEIAAWSGASEAQRRTIKAALPARRAGLTHTR